MSAKYSDIEAISMELANRLFARVNGVPHEIASHGSRYMWAHFLRQWKACSEGSEL